MVPENLNKIKTFIWTNKDVSCFFMREMQHLYITTICWTFLWKNVPNHNCNSKYNLLKAVLHYLIFKFLQTFHKDWKAENTKQFFFSIFLSLLLFQFFPPGNTKFSTVCKITLLSVSNFYFQIFDFFKISYSGSSLVA